MAEDQHTDDTTMVVERGGGGAVDEREMTTGPALPSRRVPELNQAEQKEVLRRRNISAVVVHETVRDEGERELRRHPIALAWSGLGAGLAMGFSLVTQGLLHAYLPRGVAWGPLLDNLGYSMGFVIVVLGRMHLFTENTVKAALRLLAHPTRERFRRVLRLWCVVFLANVAGAAIFAAVVAHSSLFTP